MNTPSNVLLTQELTVGHVEGHPKVTEIHPKVTECHPKVTESHPNESHPKVTRKSPESHLGYSTAFL